MIPSERAAGRGAGAVSTTRVPQRQRAWHVSPPGGRFREEPLALSQMDGHGLVVSARRDTPEAGACPQQSAERGRHSQRTLSPRAGGGDEALQQPWNPGTGRCSSPRLGFGGQKALGAPTVRGGLLLLRRAELRPQPHRSGDGGWSCRNLCRQSSRRGKGRAARRPKQRVEFSSDTWEACGTGRAVHLSFPRGLGCAESHTTGRTAEQTDRPARSSPRAPWRADSSRRVMVPGAAQFETCTDKGHLLHRSCR